MDRRKNALFWGLKVTPWLFGFPPPPCPLFFLFILVGIFSLNKPPVIMELVWRKCRWVVEQDFHWNFQINFSCFSHFSLACWGIVWRISPPPTPPAQVVSQQHCLWTLKLLISQLIQGVAGLESQYYQTFLLPVRGGGVGTQANVFAIIFFRANRPFSWWRHLTATTRIHFILVFLFKFSNPTGLLKQYP